ncbi:hypothetical protein [Streptomyces olivaceus]|uniref:hypothetical protein n=2 Tax=Streptomyces TaxID=1883 RepID=UPI001CCEC87A|nr:hypothetical protein [Streptomyces olivaceus]
MKSRLSELMGMWRTVPVASCPESQAAGSESAAAGECSLGREVVSYGGMELQVVSERRRFARYP